MRIAVKSIRARACLEDDDDDVVDDGGGPTIAENVDEAVVTVYTRNRGRLIEKSIYRSFPLHLILVWPLMLRPFTVLGCLRAFAGKRSRYTYIRDQGKRQPLQSAPTPPRWLFCSLYVQLRAPSLDEFLEYFSAKRFAAWRRHFILIN